MEESSSLSVDAPGVAPRWPDIEAMPAPRPTTAAAPTTTFVATAPVELCAAGLVLVVEDGFASEALFSEDGKVPEAEPAADEPVASPEVDGVREPGADDAELAPAEVGPAALELAGVDAEEPEGGASVRALLHLSPYARVPHVVIERVGENP